MSPDYYHRHRAEILAKAKARREADPEVFKERTRRWRQAHPEAAQASVRNWAAKHPHYFRDWHRRKAARALDAGQPQLDLMKDKNENHLEQWLTHPGADEYLGRTPGLKLAVLLHLVTGEGSLVEIAHRFNVSKQALTKHAAAARRCFGLEDGKPQVDCLASSI